MGDPKREDGKGPLAVYLAKELCWLRPDDLVVGIVCLADTAVPACPPDWGGQKYKQLLPCCEDIGKVPHSFAFSKLSLQQLFPCHHL